MASKCSPQQNTCDIHTDKKAQALCLHHYELLCFQCAIDKAKSGDCRITELQDDVSERVHCILEHLCARETVKQLLENKSKHLSITQTLKEKLLQDVDDLYKDYTSRLEEMAQVSLKSIQEKADGIEDAISAGNKFLNDREMQLTQNLEKLKDKDANINECIEQLTTIQADLSKEINEKMSEPEGFFKPDETLRQCMRKQSLGLDLLIHQKHYDDIGNTDDNDMKNELPPDQKDCEDLGGDLNSGSDIYYSAAKAQSVKSEEKKHKGTWKLRDLFKWPGKGNKQEASSEAAERNSTATIETKGTQVLEPLNVGSEGTELRRTESKFKIESMVDKALEIPDVRSASSESVLKFTKMIHIDNCVDKNWFGFLADSTILVTEFPNGPTMRKKFPKQVSSIAPIGPREMAVLSGQQITTLGIQNGRLTSLGAYVVHEDITDVTGFDFNVQSSRYAISTRSAVLLLDKKAQMIKTCAIEQATRNDDAVLKSVYDFDSDHVVYLNIDSRTLKALTCKKDKGKVVWQKKFSEDNSLPKDICIFNDFCCVAFTSSIVTCSKSDGKPESVNDTYDVLPDCLAMCVTEGIALWTSDSDDPKLSTRIGCIALCTVRL